MQKNKRNKLGDIEKKSSKIIALFGDVININQKILIGMLITFAFAMIISLVDVITTETVAGYSIDTYELNQISDRTIICSKTVLSELDDSVIVKKGDVVIKKGFPITEKGLSQLKAIASNPASMDFWYFFRKALFLFLLFVLAVSLFIRDLSNKKIEDSKAVFLCSIFAIIYIIASFATKIPFFSSCFMLPVIIPVLVFVILVKILYNSHVAVIFAIIVSVGVFIASSFMTESFFLVFFSSVFCVVLINKVEKRQDLVVASFYLALSNALLCLVFYVIFDVSKDALFVNVLTYSFNGFLSAILALGLLTPVENMLNTASVFRLLDLSDVNNPVLKRMLLTASGTYNHSMLVATLAENACSDIGANPLLARVGAYYHDLGKMEQPEYFVENQSGINKHDEINPRLSASVIKSHVKKGVEKARQMHLPQDVIDIIAEHHGNGLIAYFYNEAKKTDDSISEEEFSYQGNPPSSKESAVVMLADTVEAACRTLDNPSVSRLEKFINTLVMNKFSHKQLDNANLTFKELDIIQTSFVKILAGYYHSRIEYPNQKDPDDNIDDKKGDKNE